MSGKTAYFAVSTAMAEATEALKVADGAAALEAIERAEAIAAGADFRGLHAWPSKHKALVAQRKRAEDLARVADENYTEADAAADLALAEDLTGKVEGNRYGTGPAANVPMAAEARVRLARAATVLPAAAGEVLARLGRTEW